MRYAVGIDLGTTFSAAAIAEGDRVEIFTLGSVAPAIPSVVLLRDDGEVLVGEAAERRSIIEPGRTGREFKRRLGDPAPLLLGGTPYGAEALMARLLRAIVDAVTERQGGPPDRITITHPANYGPYKLELLGEMVRLADIREVDFLSEPEAAAVNYAQQNRLETGQVVAVYDFGGGTFDAAVLRKNEGGFEVLGRPEGMDRLGGIDFDQAIFGHVDDVVGGMISDLDTGDPQARSAIARLRADVRAAKEALSTDTDVTIPVMVPGLQTDVRLTRTEFEGMVRPRLTETISALERAVRSTGLAMEAISRILLVGGSSRIPLVAEMVGTVTGRPVALDAHPKFAIALGAARAAFAVLPDVGATMRDAREPIETPVQAVTAPASTPPRVAAQRSRRFPVALIASLVLLAAGGVAAFAFLGNRDNDGTAVTPSNQAGPTTTGSQPTPTTGGSATLAPSSPEASAAGPPDAQGATITTFAGSGSEGNSGDGGSPTAAQFERAGGVAVAPDGSIYILDYGSGTLRVVRDGTIETAMTDLSSPSGIGVDAEGVVYVADTGNDRILSLDPDGNTSTVAGLTATGGATGDGGPASDALLEAPHDIAVDAEGNVYIADSENNRVRRIDSSGTISTVVGTGSAGSAGDGEPATEALLDTPRAVAVDADGNLYVADTFSYRVRRVDTDGTISTIAGSGDSTIRSLEPTGRATEIPLPGVEALAVDTSGQLYLATNPSSYVLRIDADGAYAVVAGGGGAEEDGVPAVEATFAEVWGLAIDPQTGSLYIATGSAVRVVEGVAAPR